MKKINTIFSGSFISAIVFVVWTSVASAAGPACTNLSADLQYGDSNLTTGGQVTVLQNFLTASGYLSASANGHFGQATLSAVKSFQAARGIAKTGFVGPATRSAIQKISCVSTATASLNNQQVLLASTTLTQIQSFSAPNTGETLKEGNNYSISWNGTPQGIFNIVLEDQYGAGAGFIAQNLSGATGYTWKVGNIYSSSVQANTHLDPGTYRIRIVSLSGPTPADKMSGFFTVTGQPLSVNSIMPNSVPNDNASAVVLYGSGFDSTSHVYFDAIYGIAASILYTSSDGKVLVFSVPTAVSTGSHLLSLTNNYSSSTAATSITITN
jgi:peptidoglycan hydrolase-like protein with peptidoglycan-binding domain